MKLLVFCGLDRPIFQWKLLNQIKEELNIEIKFHCLKEDLLDLVKEYDIKEPIFPLKRYMVPIWEK